MTIPAANRYLEEVYLPERHRRFSVRPASSVDAHRPAAGLNLAAILSVQTYRTVASDYTVRHAGRRYQIERRSIRRGLRGGKVLVEERLDGVDEAAVAGPLPEVPPAAGCGVPSVGPRAGAAAGPSGVRC